MPRCRDFLLCLALMAGLCATFTGCRRSPYTETGEVRNTRSDFGQLVNPDAAPGAMPKGPQRGVRKPKERPVSVSEREIDLGSTPPPSGPSVLEYLEGELARQESAQEAEGGPHEKPAQEPPSAREAEPEAKDDLVPASSPGPSRPPREQAQSPPDETAAVRWLSSNSWARQAAACRFFTAYPSRRALKPLAQVALSDTPASRFAAEALTAAGDAEAAHYLLRTVLRSSIPDTRLYAAQLLCFETGAEADRFIPLLIERGEYRIRMIAARAAGRRRISGAAGPLRRVMADEALPERLRLEAAGAILRIDSRDMDARALLARSLDRGGISALSALDVLSVTPGDWPARVLAGVLTVREERVAFTALSGLVLRPPEEGLKALNEAFGPPADQHPRVLLAKGLLRALSDPSAVLRLLEEGSAEERHLAVRLVRFLRLEDLKPRLEEIARTDPHPSVRQAAAGALDAFTAKDRPQVDWTPRTASRAYVTPGGDLAGAFIIDSTGEETFFRPGARLPDGSILEGIAGGALRIRKRNGATAELPVADAVVKGEPAQE